MGWDLLSHLLFMVHFRCSIATPSISHDNRIRINNFIFRWNHFSWSYFFLFCFFLFFIIKRLRGLFKSLHIFLFFLFLGHLICFDLVDFLLKFCLRFVNIQIFKKWIICFNLDSHESRLTSFTFQVLHNLVVLWNFLFIFWQNSVYTIKRGISYEFLELFIHHILFDFIMEYNIISRN